MTLTEHGFFYADTERKNLTSFDTAPVGAFGVKLSGGPAEMRLTTTNGTLVIAGGVSLHMIELPEGWSLRTPDQHREVTVHQSGRSYQIAVAGKETVEFLLERK